MIREPILRAALCYPAERSLASGVRLLSKKTPDNSFILKSRTQDAKERSVGC